RPDDWGLDICVAAPQKCLAGPPGMSLVSVSDEAWAKIRANRAAPRGSFLSLLYWKCTWIDGDRTSFPYTPSVSDVNGVSAACDEALEMGIDAFVALHARAARASRAGARGMGLELWARSEEICSSGVTAVRTPEGIDPLALLAHVREHYGVMLSPGYGEIKEKLLRLRSHGRVPLAPRSHGPRGALAQPRGGTGRPGPRPRRSGRPARGRRRPRRGARGALAGGRDRVLLPAFDLQRASPID